MVVGADSGDMSFLGYYVALLTELLWSSETSPDIDGVLLEEMKTIQSSTPFILRMTLLVSIAVILVKWNASVSALIRRGLAMIMRTSYVFFVSHILKLLINLAVVMSILDLFGINVVSFSGVITAVTVAVGLGFQQTLSNASSGAILLFLHPFDVGDYVDWDGGHGTIVAIEVTHTCIRMPDNKVCMIPNNRMCTADFQVLNRHPERRVTVPICVARSEPVKKVIKTLRNAVNRTTHAKDHDILIDAITATATEFHVRCWVPCDEFVSSRHEITLAVAEKLQEDGIQPPPLVQLSAPLQQSS